MPKKVFPSAEAFTGFEAELVRLNFRPTTREEFRRDRVRLGLVPPSHRTGFERGYVYTRKHGYEVVVWTSYLPREGIFREKDAGRVLIRDGDEPLYHAPDTHRTKKFLDNLLIRARLARSRVKYRPDCPNCGALMNIVKGKALGSRHWQCNKPAHSRPVCRSWDYGLPDEALAILKTVRRRRRKYYAKLRAEGKKPRAGILRRKGWKANRPHNVVPARR